MNAPQLEYLRAEAPSAADRLEWDGRPVEPGERIPLCWERSPIWNPRHRFSRIILGSDPDRADVRLVGTGVQAEHIRFYISNADGSIEMRPMHGQSTRLDGRSLERLEECTLQGGEELTIGPWVFRLQEGRGGGKGAGAERA